MAMTDNQNSVKIEERGRYHHGDLRQALLGAAEAVLSERGIDGFSLRETARRAGVSASAPAHHFQDSKGLLTALAASAFSELADELEAAERSGDRPDVIRAQGVAYVRFGLARPAKFDLMWRSALLNHEDPALSLAGRRAFDALDRAVRGEAASAQRGDKVGAEAAASIAAWSLVHGFVRLCIDGAFGGGPGEAEQAAATMLPAVLQHLVV